MATLSSNTEERLKENKHNVSIKEELEGSIQTSDTLLPQDVLCDSCMDSPSRALKSCLTCLVSYCESHLRPHLENAKFQNHRLVDPLHDINGETCEVHQLPLKGFCLMEDCFVCLDCESQEHGGHTAASLEQARTQIETELQRKQGEISESASEAEKAIEKLQNNNDLIKSSVEEVCAIIEQQFTRLQRTVEEAREGIMEVLEGEQKQALRQTEGIQAHLEQRRAELLKTLAQINKLSRRKSDINFLQVSLTPGLHAPDAAVAGLKNLPNDYSYMGYCEWKKRMTAVCLPIVNINRMDHLSSYAQAVTDVTQELCNLILSSYREKLSMICKSGTKSPMPESQLSNLPDPETREDFLKYSRNLTFDPDTAHHFLRIMEDNKRLTNTSPWQHSYLQCPERFEYWRQAMTSESLYLGRHYIEAELSGEGAHVGVTYKSIDRKGEQSRSCITGNDFSWCMGRNSRGFSAWHAGIETVLEVTDITRIGLYIDFHQGLVSFYNVTCPMKLLHAYTADLIEPLYVTVWLSKKDNVVSLVNA